MSRYQEVPVKHETTHISSVRHTIGQPSLPTTLPSSESVVGSSIHPVGHHRVQQSYPFLFFEALSQSETNPHSAPVRPHDFAPFIDATPRRQADIPSILCGASNASFMGASGSSPESRRPVRVINVQGYPSGGTVTCTPMVSVNSAKSNPSYRVVREDGGGLCSTPSNSAPVTSPNVSPYHFSNPTNLQPELRVFRAGQPASHLSSIYIDSSTNPSRNSEPNCDPLLNSQSDRLQKYQYSHGTAVMQPLSVSLSSLATGHGNTETAQCTVSFSQHPFNTSPGISTPSLTASGCVMNMAGGVNRFTPEGASPSPPHSSLSMAVHGMSQLNISPGSGTVVSAPVRSISSPSIVGMGINAYSAASPVLLPKSHRLQHQRSTGSSTSRSDSIDSEHSSTYHPCEPVYDPLFPPRPSPPTHFHRGIHGVGVIMPALSPASSQSSLSSESSARDRDPNSVPRQPSRYTQEEDGYMQALLEHQQQRMNKLTEDLNSKQYQLHLLQKEVSDAEQSKISSVGTRLFTGVDIAELCKNNRRLQTDIQMFLNEIDMYKNGQTPFGIIDPVSQQDFFNNMPTGPNDLFSRLKTQQPSSPPPRPPREPAQPSVPPQLPRRVNLNDLNTPVPVPLPGHSRGAGSADSEEGDRWACVKCTFENHPALKKCEMCDTLHNPATRTRVAGAGLGLVGSVSMPQLHHLGSLQGRHPTALHRGAGGEVCYCHNRTCQQKLHKV